MSLSRDQESLLELLIKVKQFLDDNGITFYLFGGSCIGALRHHGFIPWDDDIDIIMDRENYEKLIEASYNMPYDDIEFWCFEKSGDYFKAFGQFSSKKDTYFLKSRVFNRGLCMGTIIDVFVMDYVPSAQLEEYKKNLVLYEEVLGFYRLHRDEIADYKEEYFELVEREKNEGRKNVIHELQNNLEKYGKDESDLLVTRFWVKKLRNYKKEWFGKPRYCEFEGHLMPIPAKAEATLRQQYGYDWYRLPKEEQRRVHSFYANHEISNNNYVEDMEQFIDTSNIPEILENRKHYQVERLAVQLELDKVGAELLLQRLLLENANAIKNKDYEKLDAIINKIKDLDGSKLRETLGDSFIVDWLNFLIENGRVCDALKITDKVSGSNFGSTLEDNLKSTTIVGSDIHSIGGMVKLINQILLVEKNYQDNNLEELEKELNCIPKEIQLGTPECILANAKLLINKKADNQILEKTINKNQEYLHNHPENYDVMKVQADLLKTAGNTKEASKLYDKVSNNSRNGLDLLELS